MRLVNELFKYLIFIINIHAIHPLPSILSTPSSDNLNGDSVAGGLPEAEKDTVAAGAWCVYNIWQCTAV